MVEKLGTQEFAKNTDAKHEYEQYTRDLAPYMDEIKKALAKTEAAERKRMEKEVGVSSRVQADIKEHEVIMNYFLKKGEITKRQAEGLREWEKVDNHVGAGRRKILEPHILQGSLSEKIHNVNNILSSL